MPCEEGSQSLAVIQISGSVLREGVLSKADRHDAGTWRCGRFQGIGNRPTWIREINDERAPADRCEHIDECADELGVDMRLVNGDSLRWRNRIGVANLLPPLVRRFDRIGDRR